MSGLKSTTKKAFEATKALWRRGYPVGTSSGLNYAASIKIAKKRGERVIMTLFPDASINSFKITEKYIITGKIEDI